MLNITKETLRERILGVLETQKFADWYNGGNFDKWITGDEPRISEKQIRADVDTLFRLDTLN